MISYVSSMKTTTDRFNYKASEKCFISFASDLGQNMPQFHPIVMESENGMLRSKQIGLTLTSAKTGVSVDYYLDYTRTDEGEGEIQFWLLKPTPESVRRVPSSTGTLIRLYND